MKRCDFDFLEPDGTIRVTLVDFTVNANSIYIFLTGSENPSLKVAAATYLKNFTRKSTGTEGTISEVSKEFKDQLLLALLQAEPAVLKVLLELVGVFNKLNFIWTSCCKSYYNPSVL